MAFSLESHGSSIDVSDQCDVINQTLEFFVHRGIFHLLEILLAVPDCANMGSDFLQYSSHGLCSVIPACGG